ncbi:MAG TPA: prolyl oligopeptidase family serine peptidase [Bacteroidales bacterium]|mgnify:FL=1|nr:prolyl oligopeptidase family serine peptidase [Bacteroidales bacterium]HOX74653.1 prolyl oligopeptidase family serine peptidase [Bacteroidales bacterium]HQM69141.1 prolyl oligopeptidase family serine peptidase [Bacteroidales bacterium]
MKISKIIAAMSVSIILTATMICAQGGNGWKASPELVEKLSKSRPDINYFEEKVPQYILPDVLTGSSGKPVTSATRWKKYRRQEVLELFRENVYGRVPSTQYSKEFKVINEDENAMNGNATLKQVDITIRSEGRSLVIHLTMFVPNKVQKPVPAFLLIDNRGPANTDPTRKVRSEFWPAEEVVARGYAIAVFYNADVDPDNFDDFKNGIHGLLDRGRQADSWGTIAAWAWGASRCMDYFETDKDIDRKKVAVLGHSRGGKTALWAGAEDQRFALVISNESGCGGAALARRKYGETISVINKSFPHWFCTNYRKYNNNEPEMPVDMHMLMALIAPRALYVASAADDLWADPRGSYLSLFNSLPVYNLLKIKSSLPPEMPPLNKPVTSGKTGYHIRDGVHNMLLKDWNWFMDFADMVLK